VNANTGAARSSWLVRAAEILADAGVPSPRVDAELLALEAVGMSRPLDTSVDPGPEYWRLLERRAAREPLQHLLGRAWFRHLEVQVGPGVFVPRPETEVVAQAAVDEARCLVEQGRPAVVVDLGTGSGVIALAVATEVPPAEVHAVELDESAYAWAQRNCAGSTVRLHRGDLHTALSEADGRADVVVSNPPYIPPEAVPVDPEVAHYDPPVALFGGGEDGLCEVRGVVATAARLLRPGGLVVIEHAEVQSAAVAASLTDGWTDVVRHQDLARRPRFVTGRRVGSS
jgi:release factor glutamine methyltransferase